jgi:signal peptide peptidase SppA
MKYARILEYVASTPWAITSDKLHELLGVLAFRASGQEFTPEEIKARIGDGGGPRPASSQQGGVAVVPIRGVIAHRMGMMDQSSGGASCEGIGAMIDAVAADPNISTIVYDCDTPGGTVVGTQELAAKMFALRGVKKQIAMVQGMACSAGYWLASQCDEIVSIPSGITGSIGVLYPHKDLSAALEKEGIKITLLTAGKYKASDNPFVPLADEERAVLQARVDDAYGQFVKDVARGRGVTPAVVRNGMGEGRALVARDAKAAGLIDRIDTMDGTLARLTGRARVGGMRAEDEAPKLAAETPPATIEASGESEIRRRRLGAL